MTEVGLAIGPQGQPGMLYHAANQPAGIPAPLTWRQIAQNWWLGFAPAAKPKPDDLRDFQIPIGNSYKVRLADGNEWEIPIIMPCTHRDPHRQSGLPQVYKTAGGTEFGQEDKIPSFFLKESQVVLEVPEHLRTLVSTAAEFRDCFLDEDAPSPPSHKVINFATACLAVIHRVRVNECMALGLFTQESVRSVILAAIDAPEYGFPTGEKVQDLMADVGAQIP
jgi:hypothetical protein